MRKDINVLTLVKDSEYYMFVYDVAGRRQTLRMLKQFGGMPPIGPHRRRVEYLP